MIHGFDEEYGRFKVESYDDGWKMMFKGDNLQALQQPLPGAPPPVPKYPSLRASQEEEGRLSEEEDYHEEDQREREMSVEMREL